MRVTRAITVLATLALAACGPAQLVVTAEISDEADDGTVETTALADLEVQAIPFDRDAVFDSMAAAYPNPEPAIPDSVLEAQERVRVAQEEWRQAELRWQSGRDRLQEINQEMEGLNRGEARYSALFREFGDVEAQVARAEREMNAAFENFTEIQEASIQAAEEACIMQANWGDEAFAGVGEIMEARAAATGRRVAVDTTDAQGIVTFELKAGTWWIHSRYLLPYEELYWNEMIEVTGGDPVQIRLNRDNAESRLNIC
jgi:hypothetical protein